MRPALRRKAAKPLVLAVLTVTAAPLVAGCVPLSPARFGVFGSTVPGLPGLQSPVDKAMAERRTPSAASRHKRKLRTGRPEAGPTDLGTTPSAAPEAGDVAGADGSVTTPPPGTDTSPASSPSTDSPSELPTPAPTTSVPTEMPTSEPTTAPPTTAPPTTAPPTTAPPTTAPPTPPTTAPTDSTGSSGTTRWSGDFESGSTSPWSVRQAADGRVSTYSAGSNPGAPAPLQGRYAAQIQTTNYDFRSPNVRSQLDGPAILGEGDDVYYRFAVNFPTDFPSNLGLGSAFYTFAELNGAPFDGVPINGVFGVRKDSNAGPQRISWSRSAEFGYDEPWSIPLTKGSWNDFVFHTKLSRDGSVGYVEIWHNGVKQTFRNGSSRIYQQTYRSNNTSGLYPVLTNYRAADSYGGTVTIYVDAAKLGTTLDSVSD